MEIVFVKSLNYVVALATTSSGIKIPFYQSSGKNGIAGAFLPFAGWECTNALVKSGHKHGQLVKGLLKADRKVTFEVNTLSGLEYRSHEARCTFSQDKVLKISNAIGKAFDNGVEIQIPKGNIPYYTMVGFNSLLRVWLKGSNI